MALRIEIDDLSRPAVQALLQEHLADMHAQSPPESVHALDLDRLRHPDITFWSVWDGDELVGCGAVKRLDATHGELKSMRTPRARRRRGAGRAILAHAIAEARGWTRLSLETGTQPGFVPARTLYAQAGFVECGPFGDYREDPHSVFMTLALG
ncbi:GNAT family N-acetyltransferase [Piscinibacter sakaiensis]|uniref:GNAT family N-acetyltransferase n=1 Tax=Piscinibacter sakaiensis TaxID=1547922 RepID=UPI003727B48E